jgi:hypothetical protein
MAETPRALLAHASPGRLRLRLPALRGESDRLAALALAAADLPGVLAAEASAVTGSLLLLHRGEAEALLAAGEAAGLFARRAPEPASAPAIPPAMLLPAAGAALAALLALVQLFRREALPPALTLGWYAAALARRAAEGGDGPLPEPDAEDA